MSTCADTLPAMAAPGSEAKPTQPKRHRLLKAFLGLSLLALVAGSIWFASREQQAVKAQEVLDPFYSPPNPLPAGRPGDIIRVQSISGAPSGALAWRVLYLTERADGSRTASSGMVIAPNSPAPAGGRPVVAWAHGTVGLGVKCTPSRAPSPFSSMDWLGGMLDSGWVVTATDYAGLGTPGTQQYLVGRAEAHDVLNSIRAAQQISDTAAGNRYAVWGHSQGGHSALWSAVLAPSYAPELELVAASAAAPAAEIAPLMHEQYAGVIGWVIGSEIFVSWPSAYPELDIAEVATSKGAKTYKKLATDCMSEAAADAEIRNAAGEKLFTADPTTVPSWYDVALSETPPPLSPGTPLIVAQGLSDEIVLPDTTAALTQSYCSAGSNLTTVWLGDTSHEKSASVSGPFVTTWLQERFAGTPAQSNCGTQLPVAPADLGG